MLQRLSVLVLLLALLSACAGAKLTDVNYSLSGINAAIEKELTMGIQGYSENHREYYSKPFVIKQSDQDKKEGYRRRGRAKVVVLGDQRPYTIEADVWIERARVNKKGEMSSEYEVLSHDKRLARLLLKNILASIERRDQDRNFIDDFRPF